MSLTHFHSILLSYFTNPETDHVDSSDYKHEKLSTRRR